MSRTKYLTHLENVLSANRKVIDELTRENYELKVQLKQNYETRSTDPRQQHLFPG